MNRFRNCLTRMLLSSTVPSRNEALLTSVNSCRRYAPDETLIELLKIENIYAARTQRTIRFKLDEATHTEIRKTPFKDELDGFCPIDSRSVITAVADDRNLCKNNQGDDTTVFLLPKKCFQEGKILVGDNCVNECNDKQVYSENKDLVEPLRLLEGMPPKKCVTCDQLMVYGDTSRTFTVKDGKCVDSNGCDPKQVWVDTDSGPQCVKALCDDGSPQLVDGEYQPCPTYEGCAKATPVMKQLEDWQREKDRFEPIGKYSADQIFRLYQQFKNQEKTALETRLAHCAENPEESRFYKVGFFHFLQGHLELTQEDLQFLSQDFWHFINGPHYRY